MEAEADARAKAEAAGSLFDPKSTKEKEDSNSNGDGSIATDLATDSHVVMKVTPGGMTVSSESGHESDESDISEPPEPPKPMAIGAESDGSLVLFDDGTVYTFGWEVAIQVVGLGLGLGLGFPLRHRIPDLKS